jgi:hypothetical protein
MANAKKKAPARKPGATTRPAAQPSRADKERRAIRNRLIFGAILLVVAGIVVFAAARPGNQGDVEGQLRSGAGSCTTDGKFDGDAANQGDHVANPTYEVDPPAGGPHLATPANPGFYEPGKAPPDGQLVHAMEHGFVVLWYRPDLPAPKMDELATLSDNLGRELLVVPRESLSGEVAVTAWHRRLLCGELVPEKVTLFTRSYVDQGPEKGFL